MLFSHFKVKKQALNGGINDNVKKSTSLNNTLCPNVEFPNIKGGGTFLGEGEVIILLEGSQIL